MATSFQTDIAPMLAPFRANMMALRHHELRHGEPARNSSPARSSYPGNPPQCLAPYAADRPAAGAVQPVDVRNVPPA